MVKRPVIDVKKKESILGFILILLSALAIMLILYLQTGFTIYILLIPIVVMGSLFFAYEIFKAFLRMVGRELEMGKKEVEEDKNKGKLFMLVCPKCKAKNPSDSTFCFSCGEKI